MKLTHSHAQWWKLEHQGLEIIFSDVIEDEGKTMLVIYTSYIACEFTDESVKNEFLHLWDGRELKHNN